jgi:hypothetical protein|tara:strand:- start:264 stop:491 length:228 start_codon:yes stop_codon:yes gene_type:complete
MNMGGLERQLMSSFKDMETKEKEKEQKAVAQSLTKEQAAHEEKIKKSWAIKFGPKFRKNKKTKRKMAKASRKTNR